MFSGIVKQLKSFFLDKTTKCLAIQVLVLGSVNLAGLKQVKDTSMVIRQVLALNEDDIWVPIRRFLAKKLAVSRNLKFLAHFIFGGLIVRVSLV